MTARHGDRRGAVRVLALVLLASLLGGVLGGCGTTSGHPAPLPTASTSTGRATPAPSSPSLVPSSPPSSPPAGTHAVAPFHVNPQQRTPGGMWWGVDSTDPIDAAALSNVRGWYRGGHTPVMWGRYISGPYALRPGELRFAAAHHILVYLIVPDKNCSACSGGDDCGNDISADQARTDAQDAIRAAIAAHVPRDARLFKDIEQVGSCSGELTATYLLTWARVVRSSRYIVGFYGNTFHQDWDFPTQYSHALDVDPAFGPENVLADDEPEPAIGAPQGSIGPSNAPPFQPFVPHCAAHGATRLWQYGESLTGANVTDVDELVPGTGGLLRPDGSVT